MTRTDNQGFILLVDDEPNALRVLSAILRERGYDVQTAKTAEEALDRAAKGSFDTVISDYKLPGMTGIDLMEELSRRGSRVPVVMLTAYGTIEKAVDAMRRGAFNYLTKPVNPDELVTVARESVGKYRLLRENVELKSQLRERYSYKNIIGRSAVMQDVFDLVETVAKSTSNVLIIGESGTGKELVARAIHVESPRADAPFVPIDCATLPDDLLESELFGHEKGSFTGAHERKTGQIEYAHGGTIFLDEVGELPLPVQKKFLRFIQEREILRIGGQKRIKVDVRIIAATNRNLEEEVKTGNFREDLFFRLNVVTIRVPPLRDRREDIPLLVNAFLSKFNAANHKAISSVESGAVDLFLEYGWPGNVRELENVIERAVVLCPFDNITERFLPRAIRDLRVAAKSQPDGMSLLDTEKRLLVSALERSSWNQTKAAVILGISRKQLRTKMKNHGLLPDE